MSPPRMPDRPAWALLRSWLSSPGGWLQSSRSTAELRLLTGPHGPLFSPKDLAILWISRQRALLERCPAMDRPGRRHRPLLGPKSWSGRQVIKLKQLVPCLTIACVI